MLKNAAEEAVVHSSQRVPYTYYSNCIPGGVAGVIVHWHKEFEINYVLKGRMQFLCGQQRIHAVKGDMVIVCPNVLHGVFPDGDEDYEYDTLVFSGRLVGSAVNDRCAIAYIHPLMNGGKTLFPHISKASANYGQICNTVETIFACAKEGTAQNDLLLKSEMLRLFWLMERDGTYRDTENVEKRHDFRPVLEYIQNHYQEAIPVSCLAKLMNLSESYFMNRFRQVTGLTCVEYINQIRVNTACEILLSKRIPITEVAFSCGFENLSNFNRQFRKITGMSPREYRKTEGRRL